MKKYIWQITALFIIELMLLLPLSFAFSINNVHVTGITSSYAKVSWETDEYATGMVHYGKTKDLGYKQRHTNYLFDHSLQVYSLDDETTYYFAVESTDINGTTKIDNKSNNFYTFTTLDITPPEQVTGLTAESVSKDNIRIKWNSIDTSDFSHYIVYRDRVKIINTTQTSFDDSSLTAGTSYSYRVSAVDASDNEGTLSDAYVVAALTADSTAPTITKVEVNKITDTSATIGWLTGENATSIVYYGLNQTLDKTKEDNNLEVNHTVTVTGLSKGNTYSYKVGSCDNDNNCANSSMGELEAGTDSAQLTINATIPEFYNQRRIDITGNVKPYSKVVLYVNDMSLAVRALDREKTSNGKFEFYDIILSQNNVIKIWAQDKSENTIEKSYNLVVDSKDPVVNLEDIPSVVTTKAITIKGSVDEAVTMKIYLASGEETEPAKITGLEAKTDNNSVELSWNKSSEEDFSHYVVYRSDVGAIAITKPASYNSYKDVLVNKGKSYIYQVSAVNKFGKQGPKSNTITASISGGETGLPNPDEIVDVIGEVQKPTVSSNVSGSFSNNITLKEDGVYALKIEFIDKALNKVLIEKEITRDTTPPEIKITKPKKGSFIYENYANEVEIEGETEPFAEVHLYVGRTPLGYLNKSFDVSGLPNEIQNLPESELRSDCGLEIAGTSFCSTGADFSTKADSDGYFRFENVDLTSFLSIGASIKEVPATELSTDRELKDETDAKLVFIATDKSGLRNALGIKYRIGTCWSGNFSWELTPMLEHQSPGVLSVERLRENTEQIFFYFNYNYVGRGTDAELKHVTVNKACSDLDMLRDSRFNISCRILPSGGTTSKVNPEGKITYTAVKLDRLENMDKWLEDDWESFFKAVSNELTFPFKIIITYTHKVDGKEITETQTTCQEVTYVLDNSLIDFRKVLPDWVLYDFVDFLNRSINTINDVQVELKKIIDYVAVGCMASFMLRLAWQVYRRWVSIFDEKTFTLKKYSKIEDIEFEAENEEDKDYCKNVAKGIVAKGGYNLGDLKSIKLKYISDADLKKCFPRTAAAWENEAKLYTLYRFSCDRIFGHKTPSRWTEKASDSDLYTKKQSGTGCAVDQAVMGKSLLAVKCRDVAKDFHLDKDIFSVDDECFEVNKGNKKGLYTLGEAEDRNNDLYVINQKTGAAEIASDYVIKQTKNSYLTAQDKYCAQVCGVSKDGEKTEPQERRWNEGKPGEEPKKEESEGYWDCMPANECRNLANEPSEEGKPKIENTYLRGFTKDCFYKANDEISGLPSELGNADSVSDNPDRRYECCCINAIKAPPSVYYRFDDKARYTVEGEPGPKPAFESKKEKGNEPQGADEGEKWADMKWSYRYWKEKYETVSNGISSDKEKGTYHYEYNPDRYTSGRDFPACFGLNNWLYDWNAEPGKGKLLIIDPAKQHTSAFQCLHISGIYNRLQLLKNIMSALASCLITVRTTGRGDTGVCKELFSQYICSLIWQVIQLFRDGCLPFGVGLDFSASENKIAQYFGAGFESIWGSVADSQQELGEEYGNAKLNDLLGAGEEQLARKICLAAFGYDWELNLENVIDAAYASPSASLVQKMTSTREYLTVDPATNKAKYEYRASWLINPGCDMRNYKVELSCVSRNEMDKYAAVAGGISSGGINCEKVKDPAGNNCDCLGLDEEKLQTFYSHNTKLAQGTLEDRDWHQIITSDYRYDHLKFTLDPDSKISSELSESCFPEGYNHNGKGVFYFPIRDKTIVDITACHADLTQGKFVCTPGTEFWTEEGRAHFESVKINGETAEEGKDIVMFRGEDLVAEPIIRKLQGNPVCLIAELKKPSAKSKKWGELVGSDGTHNYAVPIEENVQPLRTAQIKADLSSCDFSEKYSEDDQKQYGDKTCKEVFEGKLLLWYKVLSASATGEHSMAIKFEDNWNKDTKKDEPDGKITLSEESKDKVSFKSNPLIEIKSIWDKDSKSLILEEEGIEIEIRSVGFDEKVKSVSYNEVKVEGEEGGQKWDLILSLRHTKDSENDCSTYGDVITYLGEKQEKRFKISVEEKASSLKPKVSFDDIDTDAVLKGEPLKIEFSITSKNEIDEAKYEVTTPENKKIRRKISLKDDCDDSEYCNIKLEKEDLEVAGGYYITVEAKDKDKNTGKDTKNFNIECQEDNLYGKCQKEECDETLGEISSPTRGCASDYKCCRTGQIN